MAPVLGGLPERLADARNWPDRLAVVEGTLAAAVARNGDPVVRPEVGQALARLARGGPSLATIATNCGFAGQAHLTRDWSALAGCSPTTWLREEFPFVQDAWAGDETS